MQFTVCSCDWSKLMLSGLTFTLSCIPLYSTPYPVPQRIPAVHLRVHEKAEMIDLGRAQLADKAVSEPPFWTSSLFLSVETMQSWRARRPWHRWDDKQGPGSWSECPEAACKVSE